MTADIVSFEDYRRKLRPTDEELMQDALANMSDEEIDQLLAELCDMLDGEEPANDEYGIDPIHYQTIITFSPSGETLWDSDWDDLGGEDDDFDDAT